MTRHLRTKPVITSMRFLELIPGINIDFYVNSLWEVSNRLSNEHGTPSKDYYQKINRTYVSE